MTAGDLDIILKIVEFITLVGGGAVLFVKLGRTAQRFDQHSDNIMEIKTEMKEFRDAIVKLAVADEKMLTMQKQIVLIEERYEELRHGEGMVYPLGSYLKPRG